MIRALIAKSEPVLRDRSTEKSVVTPEEGRDAKRLKKRHLTDATVSKYAATQDKP
jgi:hypothetical protein